MRRSASPVRAGSSSSWPPTSRLGTRRSNPRPAIWHRVDPCTPRHGRSCSGARGSSKWMAPAGLRRPARGGRSAGTVTGAHLFVPMLHRNDAVGGTPSRCTTPSGRRGCPRRSTPIARSGHRGPDTLPLPRLRGDGRARGRAHLPTGHRIRHGRSGCPADPSAWCSTTTASRRRSSSGRGTTRITRLQVGALRELGLLAATGGPGRRRFRVQRSRAALRPAARDHGVSRGRNVPVPPVDPVPSSSSGCAPGTAGPGQRWLSVGRLGSQQGPSPDHRRLVRGPGHDRPRRPPRRWWARHRAGLRRRPTALRRRPGSGRRGRVRLRHQRRRTGCLVPVLPTCW